MPEPSFFCDSCERKLGNDEVIFTCGQKGLDICKECAAKSGIPPMQPTEFVLVLVGKNPEQWVQFECTTLLKRVEEHYYIGTSWCLDKDQKCDSCDEKHPRSMLTVVENSKASMHLVLCPKCARSCKRRRPLPPNDVEARILSCSISIGNNHLTCAPGLPTGMSSCSVCQRAHQEHTESESWWHHTSLPRSMCPTCAAMLLLKRSDSPSPATDVDDDSPRQLLAFGPVYEAGDGLLATLATPLVSGGVAVFHRSDLVANVERPEEVKFPESSDDAPTLTLVAEDGTSVTHTLPQRTCVVCTTTGGNIKELHGGKHPGVYICAECAARLPDVCIYCRQPLLPLDPPVGRTLLPLSGMPNRATQIRCVPAVKATLSLAQQLVMFSRVYALSVGADRRTLHIEHRQRVEQPQQQRPVCRGLANRSVAASHIAASASDELALQLPHDLRPAEGFIDLARLADLPLLPESRVQLRQQYAYNLDEPRWLVHLRTGTQYLVLFFSANPIDPGVVVLLPAPGDQLQVHPPKDFACAVCKLNFTTRSSHSRCMCKHCDWKDMQMH